MQKNETVLTPIYRYTLEVLESNSNTTEKILQVQCFKRHLQADLPSENIDFAILDSVIKLLKMNTQSEESRVYWSTRLLELQNDSCVNCCNCRSCKVYFWKELGELYFGVVNDQKQDQEYLPVRLLPEEISKHFQPAVGMSQLYHSRRRREKSGDLRNKFVMLKGMSSSTPAMLNNIFDTEEFVGGGFYFNWDGYGVAIDPGYHFVRNLHHHGLSVLDIDAVIITHEHIDHNNDMRLLDDLHFSVFHYDEQPTDHSIDWYMDQVSYDIACTLQKQGAGFKSKINRLHQLEPNEAYELKSKSLKLETFPTEHILDKNTSLYRKHTVGCKFRCVRNEQIKTMVYTSDTRYYPELTEIVNDADVIIANISSVYEDDFMLIKEKDTHLGYGGCYNLIENCYQKYRKSPSLYFLSEFWNGKSDIRYDVAKCLKRDLSKHEISINVIPAEVGMVFDIETCEVQCSQCGTFSRDLIVKKPLDLSHKVEVLCAKCYF
jgi:ribonuclease BN (tRNA processing enzyme)